MARLLALVLMMVMATGAARAEWPSFAQLAASSGFGSGSSAPAAAQVRPDSLLQGWDKRIGVVEGSIKDGVDQTEGSGLREELDSVRLAARALAERERAGAGPLRAQLDMLGEPPTEEGAAEDPGVVVKRLRLKRGIADHEAIIKQAELTAARAESLATSIAELQREQFTNELLERGPSPLSPTVWATALRETAAGAARFSADAAEPLLSAESRGKLMKAGPLLLGAILGALALGVLLRRYALKRINAILASGGGSRLMRLCLSFLGAMVRLAAPAAAALMIWQAAGQSAILGEAGGMILAAAVVAVLIAAASHALANAFFSPADPSTRAPDMTDEAARDAARATIGLGLTAALDRLAMGVAEAARWSPETLAAINIGFIFIAAMFCARLARAAAMDPPEEKKADQLAAFKSEGGGAPAAEEHPPGAGFRDALRVSGYLTAIAAPLLAVAGYYALSRFLLTRMAATGALIAFGVVIYRVALEALARLLASPAEDGTAAEHDAAERAPWWLGLGLGSTFALGGAALLALLWGATRQDMNDVARKLFEGVTIGGSRLSLGDLMVGVIVFVVALTLTRLLQRHLRARILPRSGVDRGAQDSIVAGLGYAGFLLATLAAVGTAGLDLSKLAIVAGALSVGVGFGLQTIVNNFVSGIILLIERPVRVGDIIEVDGKQGSVKRIKVRSTEIEMFDRATLIVPNSSLIANAVINRTRHDAVTRLIIPIGVAYGSDVELARDTLLEIARANNKVLRYPAPQAVFLNFGASALEFELRVFLRDIGDTLAARSEMCFAIERKFRERKIEIPYAQTEVHMPQLEPLSKDLAAFLAKSARG